MVRTKKRKKVRKNTRVFRCVKKVKKTRKIGAAIAICQSSTKQNYRTGRRLKNKKTNKRGGNKTKKKKSLTKMRFIALSCLSSAVFAILDMNQLMALKNQASDSTMQSANR